MDNARPRTEARPAKQQRLERAKRGLIAGYLHSLSGRHASVAPQATRAGQRPRP